MTDIEKESLITIIRDNKTVDDVLLGIKEYYTIKDIILGEEKNDGKFITSEGSFLVGDLKIGYLKTGQTGDYGWQNIEWCIKINFSF